VSRGKPSAWYRTISEPSKTTMSPLERVVDAEKGDQAG